MLALDAHYLLDVRFHHEAPLKLDVLKPKRRCSHHPSQALMFPVAWDRHLYRVREDRIIARRLDTKQHADLEITDGDFKGWYQIVSRKKFDEVVTEKNFPSHIVHL